MIITTAIVVPKENLNSGIREGVERFEKSRTINQTAGTEAVIESKDTIPDSEPKGAESTVNEKSSSSASFFQDTAASSGTGIGQNGQEDPVITQHLWFL